MVCGVLAYMVSQKVTPQMQLFAVTTTYVIRIKYSPNQ